MSHFVHVSTTVSKLGSAIPTVNLPPIVTCRPDAPCFKDCYARRGNFRYQNAQNSMENNLLAYQENPKLFFSMIAEVWQNFQRARWFSAGDIVDEKFLRGMCWVARKCPKTEMLCFTKKYDLVNQFLAEKHIIPKNLHIVFSRWRDFPCENPHNFPETWVFFPKETEANVLIPQDAIPCSGQCSKCSSCWTLKKGQCVVFKKH